MFRQLQYQAGRFVNALTVGTQAGLMAYRGLNAYEMYRDDYLTYQGRAYHYTVYDRWYNSTIFSTLDAYAAHLKAQNNLYSKIRTIYNPVRRLVDIETSKVYPGQIDWTGGLRVGMLPVVGADKTLLNAMITILKWSNAQIMLPKFVRSGSKKGDRYLKIVDDLIRKRVRFEVLDPYKVRECTFDEVGNIKHIVIQYLMTNSEGKDFLYREEIDRNWFRIWRQYNLSAFDNGQIPDADEVYANPYGFVPVKHTPHIAEDSDPWGRVSYSGALGKFIELNDQASLAHDAARKALNPIYVAKGGRIPEQDAASRERDEIIVINIPKDGDVTTITPTVDMPGTLGNIDRLLAEIEDDIPQLALQHIRNKGGLSGVAIENLYGDASGILVGIQGNCDEGVISAMKMAISMAAYHGYKDFRMYDPVTSYEQGDLDFYLKQRDVFVDHVPKERRIQLLNESSDKVTLPIVARDLEYSEEDIALMMDSKKETEANQIAAAMRGLAQGAGLDEGEDEETEEAEVVADAQ